MTEGHGQQVGGEEGLEKVIVPARCNTSSATQKSLSTPSTAIIFQLVASAGAADNEAAVKKENNK